MIRALLLCLLVCVLCPAEPPRVGPTLRADVIAADMAAGREAVKELVESAPAPPARGFGWAWLVGGAGVIAIGLRLAKNLPGLGGMAAWVAEQVWRAYAPQQALEADEKADAALRAAVSFGELAMDELERRDPRAAVQVRFLAREVQKQSGLRAIIKPVLDDIRRDPAPLTSEPQPNPQG